MNFLKIGLIISVGYLISHILTLTNFPVFADESIYIRWSQLIIDDWQRYLFFSLNDGKTPLFMWLGTISQLIFRDQLFAGRMVSVLAGLGQLWVSAAIVKTMGGNKLSQILAMILSWVTPYWFFHHHMALHESLLALFLSIAMLACLKVVEQKSWGKWHLVLALSWGLAILTKLPAVLFLPSFGLILLVLTKKEKLLTKGFEIGVALFGGFVMFALLKLHPAFSQLFSRGGDFLFPFTEVFFGGLWMDTIKNLPSYLNYFWIYLSPALVILLIVGLFTKKHQRNIHLLFWSGVLFCLPIVLMGRVVFARYLFPAAIAFTPALALSIESILTLFKNSTSGKSLAVTVIVVLLISNGLTQSMHFDWLFATKPDQTPFVSSDRHQYLLEWSSGHGVKEVSELLLERSKHEKIAVATEGFFGTLPDGVLLYLHGRDVTNLNVQGVGVPVFGIPEDISKKADEFDQIWILVNTSRKAFDLPPDKLIVKYCRPDPEASCLELWDAKLLVVTAE